MKKEQLTEKEDSKPLVFLNTPIVDPKDDVIGFDAYVESLQSAIDAGAQMIAITSPFGTGKSSVTELLRKNGQAQKVVNVSMWSHLCNKIEMTSTVQKPKPEQEDKRKSKESTAELHKSLIYQIVSGLNNRAGGYINRRLSKNYGLIKLTFESAWYYFIAFACITFFCLGYVLPYVFNIGFPPIIGSAEIWNGVFLFISIICFAYIIIRSEFVFSSNKSEGIRIIEESELMEIYRKYLLRYTKCRKYKKYIFVIEDIDRSDNSDCVISFLKELRKYYIQDLPVEKRKIVFIVNVKPETALVANAEEHKKREKESLYAKLFDYILNIPTINIDDYETILRHILENNRAYITNLIPQAKEPIEEIDGMQWIIRGKGFGIRDIKNRLNLALTLYSSLKSKFKEFEINFKKCAVVGYLITTYEKEFSETSDQAFGKLVEAFLQGKLDKSLCQKELECQNDEYINEVISLIKSKLIDSNYRMYFYNYPKESRIYTHDENMVQSAILYGEDFDGLKDIVDRVIDDKPQIIYDCIERLKKLDLILPDLIFNYEVLYLIALRDFPEEVYRWIENLDYSKSSFEKTYKKLLSIMSFDQERTIFSKVHAQKFCEIWEKRIAENELLHFRHLLCSNFPGEICSYKSLFIGVHDIIRTEEMDLLDIDDVINLINVDKESFSVDYIEYIVSLLEKQKVFSQDLIDNVKGLLIKAEKILGVSKIALFLLQFMRIINKIIPELEELVVHFLVNNSASDNKNSLFLSYQELVNSLSSKTLPKTTVDNMHLLGRFNGYNEHVANQLKDAGYLFDSIIVHLGLGNEQKYNDTDIIKEITGNMSWLNKNIDVFKNLRVALITYCNKTAIVGYSQLFNNCALSLSEKEFDLIIRKYPIGVIYALLPANIVDENQVLMLSKYFNSSHKDNSIAHGILIYISGMAPKIAKELFYQLDFDTAIKYSSFAMSRKESVKKIFNDILDLDSTTEKLRFMEATRYMDSAWEDSILPTVKNNSTFIDAYLVAVNCAVQKSISKSTANFICSLSGFYQLNNTVTEKLFVYGKYLHYIISRTLYNKRFILDNATRVEVLWDTYMEIFTKTNHPITREHMENSVEFLSEVVKRKAYVGLSQERRIILANIRQDSDCIKNVVEYGDAFAIKYFSKIAGFIDESAEISFIDVLKGNPTLLKSTTIYNNCHKLLHGSNKKRYTDLRKKI